ncbi:hypothetical protein HMPREF1127_1265 [Fusobacterium necrophorum subsp. funduliforme Fnf 1007]|uniref:Uncharacterized protein n=1 Tax=Fusobacterium necrophorum subsp. funduliforme Fnf 1007 TaxID=1161424 RepID=A0AAN3VVV7_9FUSO|nr:hypothetical protein HMPREF1127_1265 [Fusobacterium necrophorum subsp. funduliforme Fnf 1007]
MRERGFFLLKRFWKKACYSESFMLEFLDSEKKKNKGA